MRKGLVIGCAAIVVFALLLIGVFALVAYSKYNELYSYTSEKPVELPVYQPTEAEKQEAREKYRILDSALKNNKSVEVSLSTEDLNTLATLSPDKKNVTGQLRFDLNGDEIIVEGAFPLPKTGKFAGRYLNAKLTCGVSKEDGEIKVDVKKAVANDKQVSDFFMSFIKKKNLIEEIKRKNARAEEFLNKIDDLKVKNGGLVIKTKGTDNSR